MAGISICLTRRKVIAADADETVRIGRVAGDRRGRRADKG